MLDGNMSDEKKYIKKWIYNSSRKSATKYVILLVELKAITQIGLVLSGGEIAFKFNCFSVRQKSLTN